MSTLIDRIESWPLLRELRESDPRPASFQLLTGDQRVQQVLYRRACGTEWHEPGRWSALSSVGTSPQRVGAASTLSAQLTVVYRHARAPSTRGRRCLPVGAGRVRG